MVTDFYIALKDYDAVTQTTDLWMTLFQKVREHSQEIVLLMKAGYADELLNSYIRGIILQEQAIHYMQQRELEENWFPFLKP